MRRWLAALAVLAVGCSRDVELIGHGDGGHDGAATTPDAAGAACTGLGEPIHFEGVAACTGSLAAATHRFALCSCTGLSVSAPISSDAFDSTGLTSGGQTTAAMGLGERLDSTAMISLGGALYIAGDDASSAAQLELAESLHSGGLTVSGSSRVGGDAFVTGNLSGPLSIDGTLHVPAGATLGAGVSAGQVVREPVTVAPPCGCDDAAAPDIGGAVAQAALANDDARVQLSPDALRGENVPETLDLGCGSFYLTAIDTKEDLTLRVHARVRVSVTGDIVLRGQLRVELDPGAELDLLAGGTLVTSEDNEVGSRVAPARVRIWVGGGGTVLLGRKTILGAVLDAPHAAVSAPGELELYGSVRARSYLLGGALTLHYDRAVLAGGVPCGAAAEPAIH